MKWGRSMLALVVVLLALAAPLASLPVAADSRPAGQVVDLPDAAAHYILDIAPFDLASGPLAVDEQIELQSRQGPLGTLDLTVAPNEFGYFALDSATVDGAPVANSWPHDDTLRLTLPNATSWTIELKFRLNLSQVPDGDWRAMGRDGDVLRLGNWFPLISDDHPYPATADSGYSRSASFDVYLPLPSAVPFASTGQEVDSQPWPGGALRHHLHADNVRDFSILTSPDYRVDNTTSAGGVRVEVYSLPGDSAATRSTILSAAVAALDRYSALIGEYPYPVYRIANAGASFPAGLEFPNLVFLQFGLSDLRDTVYHETAHQWLYGVIGTRTQQDLWIDEGGAQFLEEGMINGFDAPPPNTPGPDSFGYWLDSPDWELPQGGNLPGFNAIYLQGWAFYQTVLLKMGADAFWNAMQDLFVHDKYDVVTPWDVLSLWQRHSSVDLRPLYRQTFRYDWIDQLPGPGDSRYFAATDHSVSQGFLQFWDASGGLPVFGYPLTEELSQGGFTVQYFERQRFEYHPEFKGTPYEVELGLLGVREAAARGLSGSAPFKPVVATSDANCRYFAATGHRLCNGFKSYWQSHGLNFGDPGISERESLALFGYPISEEFTDPATGLTVQYFERARLEYHSENPEPYKVLGGLLGSEVLAQAQAQALSQGG